MNVDRALCWNLWLVDMDFGNRVVMISRNHRTVHVGPVLTFQHPSMSKPSYNLGL